MAREDRSKAESITTARDASLRPCYAAAALQHIPHLLGAIDRNPYRPTYGCCDRQFWHYRTSDFPSEMYQEAAWPLAMVYTHQMPGNRWQGESRVRELAIAALRFSALSCHRDGSCDDYYPYERALGAAVFSLVSAAQTYRLLQLDDAAILAWLELRADWVAINDESGRLSNHHALAALGLLHVAAITGKRRFRQAAEERLHRLLDWQSEEGWFDEYGGADPGYQTVTLDCLAKCRRLLQAEWLDEPLTRGVRFCRLFLHPDSSYGGEYGSRGTYHLYPHGFELLASDNADAADLADGCLTQISPGAAREAGCGTGAARTALRSDDLSQSERTTSAKQAFFTDDRLVAHRLGNLMEAYLDWSPRRPIAKGPQAFDGHCYLPHAQLLVCRTGATHTVVSAARGGVFKHFDTRIGLDHRHSGCDGKITCFTDAGLIVKLADGRVAVSQVHNLARDVSYQPNGLSVAGPLHQARFETATPLKFIALRLMMLLAGRWCRTLVRRLLQRRLITGRSVCPVHLARTFEFSECGSLQVRDVIELTEAGARVVRMSFGTDHQTAYVAASGVYQDAVLQPWQDLDPQVHALNRDRRVVVVRQFSAQASAGNLRQESGERTSA